MNSSAFRDSHQAAARGHFIIRNYLPGDESGINDMFNEVFSQKRDLSHWYWKYRDNPYGSHFISLAVSHNGVFAAHYGGYPVRISSLIHPGMGPEEIMTFHLGDKMTRKQYRGEGFGKSSLLARTFEHFRDTFATNSIPFGYGFGTHHSLKFGMMFLNYSDTEPVVYRRLFQEGMRDLKPSRLRNGLLGLRAETVSDIDRSWTEFFNSVAPGYRYLVTRDEEYLRWRYLRRPDRKYVIVALRRGTDLAGWSVFFRESNKIIWGDAMFREGDIEGVRSLLCYVKSLPLAGGADFIESWFPGKPEWWDVILEKIGFTREDEPLGLRLTGPVFNDPQAPEILREHFYYTLGDSDLF